MEVKRDLATLSLLIIVSLPSLSWALKAESSDEDDLSFNRTGFPAGFIFGAAGSAYQYEGGAADGGRGLSIWDTFTHKRPDRIEDHSTGDVAIDSYHRYKEDVAILSEIGLDAYRFSISWTRILPTGSLSGGVNKDGIKYYNNLIDELISHGKKPFVTLFHWDSPQALEDKYGGFLSPNIVYDYRDYVNVCFREFGDRVKHWITFNEPLSFSAGGYSQGLLAPGRCSKFEIRKCSVGDSGREPYITGHHQLLAHAEAVKLYRRKYKETQKGVIGITLVAQWFVPSQTSRSNDDAAHRAIDFTLGWFMDPITRGDYPFSMRSLVGLRLPKFTPKQSTMLKGSFDFIGLNYYTANYATAILISANLPMSYDTDSRANLSGVFNGKPIGPRAASPWLFIYPPGIRHLLIHVKKTYNNPIIFITENGVDEFNNSTLPLQEALKDDYRIDFYHQHLKQLQRAIKEGVNVKGYFAWSLLDNFEWVSGYTVRFGINFVDYKDNLKRYPKKSSIWFQRFLMKH